MARRVSPEQQWLRTKTESIFQSELLDAARRLGWIAFHDQNSRHDEAGFPDLVMVHPIQHRVLFVELKTETGRIRPEQLVWLGALMQVPAIEVYTWRPRDIDQALEILQGK
jgi:hypothetical protein